MTARNRKFRQILGSLVQFVLVGMWDGFLAFFELSKLKDQIKETLFWSTTNGQKDFF